MDQETHATAGQDAGATVSWLAGRRSHWGTIAKPGLLCPANDTLKSVRPAGSSDLPTARSGIYLPWFRSKEKYTPRFTDRTHGFSVSAQRIKNSVVAGKSHMTVFKPRTRMISVRLSEEEYVALRRLCSLTGARSVSDLTRDSMRVLLNGPNSEDGWGFHAAEFREEIRNLNKKIEELAAQITGSKVGTPQ